MHFHYKIKLRFFCNIFNSIFRLLSLLGISKHDPHKAKAWAEAMNGANDKKNKNTSTWPILMFLGIITSAPYIIYKLFGGLNQSIIDKGELCFNLRLLPFCS